MPLFDLSDRLKLRLRGNDRLRFLNGQVTNDVRKLLAWLEGAPVPEAQIVAAGFNHTLDKALMLNFVEMNLRRANNHRNTLRGS